MASSRKKTSLQKDKLPNLKICVDNTEDLSGSSSESSEEGEISDDEQPICVEAAPVRDAEPETKPQNKEPSRKLASPVQSDEEHGLNADLDDLETFGVTKPKKKRKGVEEKTNTFELGFDPTSKESVEKRMERAKRFGIDCITNIRQYSDSDIKQLYESLGVATESSRKERGVNLDTVHMRGVDDMDTNDVFAYFAIHAPARVEWIDSSSCNITWSDKMSAAHAVLCMSDDPSKALPGNTQNTQPSTESTATKDVTVKPERASDNEGADDKMEADSDPDDLDLLSSEDEDATERRKERKSKNKQTTESKDQEEMETGEEVKSKEKSDDEKTTEKMEHLRCAYRIKPPGRWRVGRPLANNKFLFLRFATQADQKTFGAGGQAGFTGQSSFRGGYHSRLEAAIRRRTAEVEAEARNILAAQAREKEQKLNPRRRPAAPRNNSSDEEEEDDERLPRVRVQRDEREFQRERDYLRRGQPERGYRQRLSPERGFRNPLHDDRVYFDEEEEEEYEPPRQQVRLEDIRIQRRLSDSEQEEELDMQAELDELLRHQLPEKRKMRMYADDEEDLMKRKRLHAEQYVRRDDHKDLRVRLGNNPPSRLLSTSRQARRRQTDRASKRPDERERSRSPLSKPNHKYEKLTIQVEADDV